MLDLEHATHTQFASCLGQTFSVTVEAGQVVEVELIAVDPVGPADAVPRQRFSLLFRGASAPVLAQRIYQMQHEGLGEMAIFLVPIGPDAEGMCYESIFN